LVRTPWPLTPARDVAQSVSLIEHLEHAEDDRRLGLVGHAPRHDPVPVTDHTAILVHRVCEPVPERQRTGRVAVLKAPTLAGAGGPAIALRVLVVALASGYRIQKVPESLWVLDAVDGDVVLKRPEGTPGRRRAGRSQAALVCVTGVPTPAATGSPP
jgi:hypothetical protein